MTTNVSINANCAKTKEVSVSIYDDKEILECLTLQDGETAERVVYDKRIIEVCEVEKK